MKHMHSRSALRTAGANMQKCILIFCITPDWSYRYEEYKYWPTLILHANYTKRYFMYSLIHAQCQENAKYAQHTLIKQSTS